LALLGFALLPSDYHAGAAVAHGHSYLENWLGCAGRGDADMTAAARTQSGIDALDHRMAPSDSGQPGSPDNDHHRDSAPAASSHLLPVPVMMFLDLNVDRSLDRADERPHRGRSPDVPLPPPRWMSAAV
jgi:hypothetical protein